MPSRNLICNAFAPLSRGQANIKALALCRRHEPAVAGAGASIFVSSNTFAALGLAEPLACAPSTGRASFNQPRSRTAPFLTCSPDAICSASPRPAPARRLHSLCRCCSTWPAIRLPPHRYGTRALILAPTRELALQIEESLRSLGGQQVAHRCHPRWRQPLHAGAADARRAPTSWSARQAASAT